MVGLPRHPDASSSRLEGTISPEHKDTEPTGHLGAKLIACAAIGMILSLGLCRVGFYLDRNIHDGAPGPLETLGGLGLVLCALVLVAGIGVALFEATRKRLS